MSFKQTTWKYSNEEIEYVNPTEGIHAVKILGADYDETEIDNPIYNLKLKQIDNGATFNVRYWLNTSDKQGNTIPARSSRGTLISLGKSLAGVAIGIPVPEDIIGGVVNAEIQITEGNNGKHYTRVYKFFPCSEEDSLESEIDQYYEGSDDTEVEQYGSGQDE